MSKLVITNCQFVPWAILVAASGERIQSRIDLRAMVVPGSRARQPSAAWLARPGCTRLVCAMYWHVPPITITRWRALILVTWTF